MKHIITSAVLLATLTACGGPLLEPGDYTVSSFFVQDDYLAQAGTESVTTWTIEEKDGKYTVTIMGREKDVPGQIDDGSIILSKEYDHPCGGTTFFADITPHDESNEEFTGLSSRSISVCDGPSLLTKAHLVGNRK